MREGEWKTPPNDLTRMGRVTACCQWREQPGVLAVRLHLCGRMHRMGNGWRRRRKRVERGKARSGDAWRRRCHLSAPAATSPLHSSFFAIGFVDSHAPSSPSYLALSLSSPLLPLLARPPRARIVFAGRDLGKDARWKATRCET